MGEKSNFTHIKRTKMHTTFELQFLDTNASLSPTDSPK